MDSTAEWTEQDREDLRYLIEKTGLTHPRRMELTDPVEERFYRRQLELAGLDRDRFPQTHRTVDEAAAGPAPVTEVGSAGPTAVHSVTQIASSDGGKTYETSSLSSVPGGSWNTTLTLGLYDENQNPIGTVARKSESAAGKAAWLTATGQFASTLPSTGRMVYSVGTVQYTDQQTGGNHFNLVQGTFNTPKAFTNIVPNDVNNDGTIKVCLTRDSGDCDYKQSWQGHAAIPISGNIEYFGNIDLDGNGKPINASNLIEIARVDEGGNPLVPPAGFDFFTAANTTISGAQLGWDLGWVNFGTPNFQSGDQVYFVFQVTLQVGGQPVLAYITNAPSSVAPGQNALNTHTLRPMEVVYGCIAAGASVTLADGSRRPIEEVDFGDKVVSDADGTILTVDGTTEGHEDEPMIRIVAGSAGPLLLTRDHPVPTSDGVKLARELEVGHEVMTEDGCCAIEDLSEEPYDGVVYNLLCGRPEDGVALTDDNRTHFANGIQVGDRHMQRHWGQAYKARPANVLAVIPEEWHQDYLSSLEL